MITTDGFSFIHLHKSGGTFVNEFLMEFVPSARLVGYHYPISLLPARHRQRPVLATVRNPWEFYVSYYAFQSRLLDQATRRAAEMSIGERERLAATGVDVFNGVDVLFEELSERGTLGFRETTYRLLTVTDPDRDFERVIDRLPLTLNRRGRDTPMQRSGFRGMNVRAYDFSRARGTGVGLYSFLARHLFGTGHEITFLRAHQLREELQDYIASQGVEASDSMLDFVHNAAPANSSAHDAYHTYYDTGLAELVAVRDEELISQFGFTFTPTHAVR